MTRDEIVELIAECLGIAPEDDDAMEEAGIVLFEGMEPAFVGLAERFETEGHRFFAVYDYELMVKVLVDDMDDTDAREYLEFNTVGLYAGPNTPAILRATP